MRPTGVSLTSTRRLYHLDNTSDTSEIKKNNFLKRFPLVQSIANTLKTAKPSYIFALPAGT